MSEDSPKTPREELEARLTALLLGELSADEAAALRFTIEQDPELARLENQLKETIGLVRQAAASKDEKTIEPAAPLQLSAERREKLLASFKTTRLEIPKKPRRTLRLNRELLKLAAMVAALLLVGGVVVSYFTTKRMDSAQAEGRGHFYGFWFGADSLPAKPARIVGSRPGTLSFESSESQRAPLYDVPPASRTRAGESASTLSAEYSADAGLERAKAQVLAQMSSKNAQTPPPPAARPAPADKQLAQNSDRFRTTIALPTSSEAQPSDTLSDVSGEMVARSGGAPVGQASSRAEGFGKSAIEGSDKFQVEVLGEETSTQRRTGQSFGDGLAGNRPSGFGGLGGGGSGVGGGRGPVAASEGKDAGRISELARLTGDPTSGKSQQFGAIADGVDTPNVGNVPITPAQPGGLADGKASGSTAAPTYYWGTGSNGLRMAAGNWERWEGESFGLANKESFGNKPPPQVANSDWFEAKDVNGPAPAIAQNPVGRASPPALFGTAPAITPNPVPAVDPATGLPAASSLAGKDSSRMGVQDTTIDPVQRRAPPALLAAQPIPSPPNQTPPPGTYYFGSATDDLGGLRIFKQPAQPAQGQVAPTTGLPVAGSVVNSESQTADALSRDREKIANVAKAWAAPISPLPTTSPSVPAATPAPALEVKEKNLAATQPLSDIDGLAQKSEGDTPTQASIHGLFTNYTYTTVNDGLVIDPSQQSAGTHVAGIITDPTHGTGDGREWGIRQKLDADGDSAERLALLGDLTQSQSKKKAPAEVQNKLAKVERGGAGDDKDRAFRTGDGSQDQSGLYTGLTFKKERLPRTAPAKPSPVADEERKKESETLLSQSIVRQRVNSSVGDVTANYAATEGAAKPVGGDFGGRISFETSEDSKRLSEASLFRKSRVEIALPPGGETVQGVEREPRVQVGPVAINEIQLESTIGKSQSRTGLSPGGGLGMAGVSAEAAQERNRYAQRLNQTVNRAASGSGEADRSGQRSSETAAEYARLKTLSDSLQSMSGDELKTALMTGAPGPAVALVLKSLSEEASRRGIPAREQFNGQLDERLEAVRAGVKAKLESLRAELERQQKELTPEQADVSLPKLAPNAAIPQPEISAAENFFSTFSLNVSDVSFKLAAASLEKGQMPDPATVRSEEFINAFDYRDPEPKGSAPIAFAWERARYPFAHNRDLLRFSIKTAASGRQPGRPLNLVLLLDNSGSMERADRVRVRMECLRVLGRQLRPEDRVSVVAFARTARLVLDGISGKDGANLPEWAGQLAPDGGTNLEDAMNLAYQTALRHFLPNGVNRVVLLTDGAANLGDVEPESLKKKVEAHRKQGVALDCFGIGWDGYNDDLLEVLSRNGDGRYGFVNTPEAAASEFAGQLAGALRVAASDVKVQVQFNPRRVTAWRQIGYAKHQLKKEQFRDNTVDAAEIGAAEQGNALYTVQVNPNGEGPLGVVRVRFKVPGTSDYREHEWAVPYSGAATPLEQCSPPLRLAATASAFSEWLVSSPFAGEVTPDRLLGYLSGVPEACAADPRPKKLEWMIRQAKSLAGK
jgi:Mg-chelatase subunit ChlD